MHAMQGAYHTHHRAMEMAGMAVIVGLAVILGIAIGAATATRQIGSTLNPPPVASVSRPWFGGTLQADLVAAEALPMGALRKVFDPADLEAITAARTQAAALAAARADAQLFDRYLKDIKSKVWTVPRPPTVPAPEDSTYWGKSLPY
jgi:hypothetical protein